MSQLVTSTKSRASNPPNTCLMIHLISVTCLPSNRQQPNRHQPYRHRVDESQLTGESDDVVKDPVATPVCFSGSKILEGYGRLLVLAVGPNSQQGLINAAVIAGKGAPSPAAAASASADSTGARKPSGGAAAAGASGMRQQTALSSKLDDLAHTIGRLGITAAAGTFLINAALHTADLAAAGRLAAPWLLDPDALQRYLDFMITSITLLVVAVPEGLPLAVTLALAFSVQRMLSDNNLVRHLDACETMASCTTICRWAGSGFAFAARPAKEKKTPVAASVAVVVGGMSTVRGAVADDTETASLISAAPLNLDPPIHPPTHPTAPVTKPAP